VTRSLIRVLFVAVAIVALASPSTLFACPNCKYSPDGWGFCFYYQLVGYLTCNTVVEDAFSGRTKCDTVGTELSCDWRNNSPRTGDGTGFGNDCEFHDVVGNCMTDAPDTWSYGF
jgi:hypothetical protein